MATLRAGLVAALKADAGVSAIVGTRVFPSHAARGAARPLIVVRVASDERGAVLSGHTAQRVARVLIECQALTSLAAESLARAVDDMFDGYQLGGSMGGCAVKGLVQQTEAEVYAQPGDGGDVGPYSHVVDYRIDYRDA